MTIFNTKKIIENNHSCLICDTCRRKIEDVGDGRLEFLTAKNSDLAYGFRVVHDQYNCRYNKWKCKGNIHSFRLVEFQAADFSFDDSTIKEAFTIRSEGEYAKFKNEIDNFLREE